MSELDGTNGANELAKRRDDAIARKQFEEDTAAIADMEVSLQYQPKPYSELEQAWRDGVLPFGEDWPVKLGGNEKHEFSWRFPPNYSDYDQLLNFWCTTEIDDAELVNMRIADQFGRQLKPLEDRYDQVRNVEYPRQKLRKKDPAEYERVVAMWQAECKELQLKIKIVSNNLGFIPLTELRTAARIGAFWLQAAEIGGAVSTRAIGTRFELASGEVVKCSEILKRFDLSSIHGAFFHRVHYARPH